MAAPPSTDSQFGRLPSSSHNQAYHSILDAAARCFTRSGYERASTRLIADEAGVNQGLLYYYFRNKEEILYSILLTSIEAVLLPALEIAATDKAATDKLLDLMRSHMRPYEEQNAALTFTIGFTQEGLLLPDHYATYIARRHRYQQAFEQVLNEGIQSGDLHPDIDVKLTVFAVLGMLRSIATWFRGDGRLSADDVAQGYWRIITDGIRCPATPDRAR